MATFDLSDTSRRVTAVGDDSNVTFPFSFQVNATSDVKVYVDGTLKTLSTHYTIVDSSFVEGLNANGTGVVKFNTSPTDYRPDVGEIVTILSDVPVARTSVYTSGGNITAASLESDFDTQAMMLGDREERETRTVMAPVNDPTDVNMVLPAKASRLGKVLGFNSSTGNPEAVDNAALTNAEVRAAVEAASDSNVFTDADHSKLDGIAASANNYSHPNHTGDVTSSGDGATTIAADAVTGAKIADDAVDSEHIADGAIDLAHMSANSVDSDQYVDGSIDTAHIGDDQVTYAKIQNVSATNVVLGRDSSGAGVIEEISASSLRTILNVEDGATADQSASEIEAIVNHDNLQGFVANEHIDWTTDQGSTNIHSGNYINTTYSVGDGGLTQNNFTDALKTKLDGIEAAATADQTATEIKTAYESNSDTNAFTDAEKTKLSGVAASANNYVHPNHSGEVTSTGDGATVIADNVVDEANLKVSNAPTDGYVLTARSGNTGGLTWEATAASGMSDLVDDTTPQLGGDLDVGTHRIETTESQMNFEVDSDASSAGYEGYYFYGGPTTNGYNRIWITGTETAFQQRVGSSTAYTAFIQNNNQYSVIINEHGGNHPAKITNWGNGSSAHLNIGVRHADAKVRFTDHTGNTLRYAFPNSTPSSGQVLTASDGSGTLSWADASGGGGGASNYTIDQKTSSYTIVSGDLGKVIEVTASSATTITLPEISGSGIGSGFYVTIWNQSGNTVTVSRSGTDQINPNTSSNADTSDNLSSGASKTYVANSNSRWIALSSSPYFYDENNVNNGNNRPQATGISSIAIGRSTLSTAINSIAIGGSSGFVGASASANGSVALGGSRAHGADSFAMGITNNTTSYGSGGANSVAIGLRAKATGNHNIALSGYSQATGSDYSVAIGYMARSNNHSSVAIGREAGTSGLGTSSIAIGHEVHTSSAGQAIAIGKSNIANGWYSVALGNYARTNGIQGKFAYSCDYINNGGDAQTGMYVVHVSTTDATATALTTTGTSAGSNNQLIVQNNSAYAFHGTIVARQKASEGTASAAWKVEGLIRREGSAGTTVLVNSATTVLDNTPSWGMALSADTTNGCLKVAVTGAASTNIRWVGTINTSELTYA